MRACSVPDDVSDSWNRYSVKLDCLSLYLDYSDPMWIERQIHLLDQFYESQYSLEKGNV